MPRFFWGVLFFGLFAFSLAQANPLVPAIQDQKGFIFNFVSHSLLKIDASLKEIGLTPLACRFKEKTYSELTPCLFDSLMTNKNDNLEPVQVWFKNYQEKIVFAKIEWGSDGLWSMTKELLGLNFEGFLKSLPWVKKNKRLNYKSFMNEIKITFPESVKLNDLFISVPSKGWSQKLDVREFSLVVHPTEKIDGYVNYKGQVSFDKFITQNNPEGSLLVLHFQTNLNILKIGNKNRPINFRAGTTLSAGAQQGGLE